MTNTLKFLAGLLAVVCLLPGGGAGSQTLVYSLSYEETHASFMAHFSGVSPFPGLRTQQENLGMLRNHRKTEIYFLRLADGEGSLLFSDEGTNLEIMGPGSASSAGKAYVRAIWREWRAEPVPGVSADTAVYELRLDGSNKFRRILDAQVNQGPALLNPQGTKAAFQDFVAGKYVVSIYSVPGWRLLHQWDLSRLMNTQCRFCTPVNSGWMQDGKRLWVELTAVGDDEDATSADALGAYIFSEDGSGMDRISPEIGALRLNGYVHPQYIERQFLGQLPNGSYVFEDFAVQKGKSLSELAPFVVIAAPDAKSLSVAPLKFALGRGVLSPSGRYLAYIENRQTPGYRTEQHLWVRDLASSEDRELFSVPAPGPATSAEPNVSLSVLGWLN